MQLCVKSFVKESQVIQIPVLETIHDLSNKGITDDLQLPSIQLFCSI